MIDENKYYVPDADELNFRFEYYHDDHEGTVLGFHPSDLRDDRIEDLLMDLHNGKIKAKYLDGDDIMSFGFEIANDEGNTYRSLNKLRGLGTGDDRTLFVQHECFKTPSGETRINTWVWWRENRGTEITIFEGSIKNKSEFRKLLKQIHANTITKEQ